MGARQCDYVSGVVTRDDPPAVAKWLRPVAFGRGGPPSDECNSSDGQRERPDAPLTRPASLCTMPRRHPSTDRASAVPYRLAVALRHHTQRRPTGAVTRRCGSFSRGPRWGCGVWSCTPRTRSYGRHLSLASLRMKAPFGPDIPHAGGANRPAAAHRSDAGGAGCRRCSASREKETRGPVRVSGA